MEKKNLNDLEAERKSCEAGFREAICSANFHGGKIEIELFHEPVIPLPQGQVEIRLKAHISNIERHMISDEITHVAIRGWIMSILPNGGVQGRGKRKPMRTELEIKQSTKKKELTALPDTVCSVLVSYPEDFSRRRNKHGYEWMTCLACGDQREMKNTKVIGVYECQGCGQLWKYPE